MITENILRDNKTFSEEVIKYEKKGPLKYVDENILLWNYNNKWNPRCSAFILSKINEIPVDLNRIISEIVERNDQVIATASFLMMLEKENVTIESMMAEPASIEYFAYSEDYMYADLIYKHLKINWYEISSNSYRCAIDVLRCNLISYKINSISEIAIYTNHFNQILSYGQKSMNNLIGDFSQQILLPCMLQYPGICYYGSELLFYDLECDEKSIPELKCGR